MEKKKEAIEHILEVGTELISKNGFNNVGLQQILTAAKIPKGSFYYYFKSKEDFGLQVMGYYSEKSLEILKSYLASKDKAPRERLLSFFRDMRDVYQTKEFTEGCLLGNCGLELSDVKASYALKVSEELDKWEAPIKGCIEEGQQNDSISTQTDSTKLAAFILNSWEGALLRMKSKKSAYPLDIFIDMVDNII